MPKLTIDKLADWVIPVLLAGTVQVLFEIKNELNDLNKNMAGVAVTLQDHERRISSIEERLVRP